MLALTLLRDPSYRGYWLALFLSQMGTWMQAASQGWLVIELTGKAERLGLVVALQFLPALFVTLAAGVWADRYPRRNLLLFTQGGMALLAFLLFLLIQFGWVRYPYLLVFALLYGTANAIDLPVRQAFTVELAGRARYPGAIALNSFGFNVSRLVGPALAGLLIAGVGIGYSYLANALSFLPMLWALSRTVPGNSERTPGNVWHEALEGIRYVMNERVVRGVVLLVGLVSVFGMNFQTLVPSYARLVLNLDAKEYGFLLSAVGLGSLLAALAQAFSTSIRPHRTLWGAVFLGLGLAGLGMFPKLALLLLSLAGLGMVTVLVNANTTVQMSSPDRLRGRVMSVYSLVLLGVSPLGSYLTGLLIDHLGGERAPLILAMLTLVSVFAVWLWAWPKRGLETTSPCEQSEASPPTR